LFCEERKGARRVGRNLMFLERGRINQNHMTILLVFSLFFPLALQASTLEEIQIDHWVYPLIDNLQSRGHFGELYLANRPYTRAEVAGYVLELAEKAENGELDRVEVMWVDRIRREFAGGSSRLAAGEGLEVKDYSFRVGAREELRGDLKDDSKELEPSYESIKIGGAVDPDFSVIGEIGGSLQYKDRMVVVDRLQFNSDPINEPSFRIRSEGLRDRNFRFSQAYIAGEFGPVSLLFGRNNLIWGHGTDRSLTISGISPPFDLLKYRIKIRTVRATGFLAFLDKTVGQDGLYNRFMYGHRMDWRVSSWMQLGFSEVAVVTGVGKGVEFRYLNPLIYWPKVQKEEGSEEVNTDVYSAVNWSLFLPPGFFVYGEFMVDDLFVPRSDSNREFPHQVAFQQGVVLSHNPLPEGLDVEFEYTRIGSFTYLHRGEATYYSHYEAPIGSPLGPDTDSWRIGLSYRVREGIEMKIDYRARRRGENRLEPGVSARGHRGESFPTGIVERRKSLGLGFQWFARGNLVFSGDFSFNRVHNLNNQRGQSDSIPNLELSLSHFHFFGGSFSGL
jgi:hypothetical protein